MAAPGQKTRHEYIPLAPIPLELPKRAKRTAHGDASAMTAERHAAHGGDICPNLRHEVVHKDLVHVHDVLLVTDRRSVGANLLHESRRVIYELHHAKVSWGCRDDGSVSCYNGHRLGSSGYARMCVASC